MLPNRVVPTIQVTQAGPLKINRRAHNTEHVGAMRSLQCPVELQPALVEQQWSNQLRGTATGITTVVRQSGGRFHALAQPTMANSNKDSATSWGNSDGSNELIAWPPAIRLTAAVST